MSGFFSSDDDGCVNKINGWPWHCCTENQIPAYLDARKKMYTNRITDCSNRAYQVSQ